MSQWQKLGFLVRPSSQYWWMQSHGMIPTPEQLQGSLYKIYFSGRNDNNQSHIGWVLVDLNNPCEVLDISQEPVLKPGRLGCFDDNGVSPSCVVKNGELTHLYYIGWNPGSTTRMNIFGGLAISKDGGKSFERYSEAPIIERCRANPFINTAPFVLKESDSQWRMYFVAGVEWLHKDLPRYHIQVAHSANGFDWRREGQVAIDFIEGENALARPFVRKEQGLYRMWFASKGEAYRLQYAESNDGLHWKRKTECLDICPDSQGPDSEMMEYAAVVNHGEQEIMFYNGNNYGEEGILVATRAR